MVSSMAAIKVLVVVLLAMALPVVVVWGVVKLLQGLFWALGGIGRGVGAVLRGGVGAIGFGVRHVGTFVSGMVLDSLRFAGAMLTAAVIVPLTLLNLCFGRWRSAAHYGRALEDELTSAAVNVYRVSVGHPIRFLGLGLLTEGIERRIPELVARAPVAPARRPRPGRFDGYDVKGTLPPGGSGAMLYLARPKREKLEAFRRAGHPDPGEVVIKAFALGTGSTLPQIVRESRALEAASRLGLVLEHQLGDDAFHYVMPFVPGERLDTVISAMHARHGDEGLSQRDLGIVMGYVSDLLQTLDRFHTGGLWHKDIKPGNLIVSNHRVHLVDLGLVTPLQSAMTLTTHGTEYFRDPEMVRLAMKGVKVHEVDGVKFDVYSAGAVLYSMIENSFPAHGSLSRLEKRCPEALKWIVRRAMAEMNARYSHAWEMLADVRKVMAARDPFTVQPADLPSMKGGESAQAFAARSESETFFEPVPLRSFPEDRFDARGDAAAFAPLADLPTTRTVRRRTSRTLVGAALWGMVLGLSSAGFVLLVRSERSGGYTRVEYGPQLAPMRALTHDHAERAFAAESERWESDEFGWSDELSKLLVTEAPAAPTRATGTRAVPAGESPRVLILEDLSANTDRGEVQELGGVLAQEGFAVLGGREGAIDPRALELEAGVRKAIGLGRPDDADSRARVLDYLAGVLDLDAVVWITSDPRSPEGIRYDLLVHPGLSTQAADLAASAAH